MIIEVEDRFCKVVKQLSRVLAAIEQAAKRGDAVHEVEETTWGGLIEMGREMIAAHIKQQDEELSRPKVIEHEGKTLHRLPKRRLRKYVSAFGPTPYLNGDWDAFHAARVQAEQRKLYPYKPHLPTILNCAT